MLFSQESLFLFEFYLHLFIFVDNHDRLSIEAHDEASLHRDDGGWLEAGGWRGHGGAAGPVLRPREEAAAAVPEPHQPPLPGQVHQHQPGTPQGQHLLLSRRVDLVPGATTTVTLYFQRNSLNFL